MLKLDIEGSEFDVIESLDDSISIKQICIEIHDRLFIDGWNKLLRIHQKLTGKGYILVATTDTKEELTYIKNSK